MGIARLKRLFPAFNTCFVAGWAGGRRATHELFRGRDRRRAHRSTAARHVVSKFTDEQILAIVRPKRSCDLLAAGGFKMAQVLPTRSPFSVIEAVRL